MIVLNNVAVGDDYSDATKVLGLSISNLSLFVFNNAVTFRLYKKNPGGGQDYELLPEQNMAPGSAQFPGAIGLQIKNAVPGAIARIILVAPEYDPNSPDPGMVGYTPSTIQLSSSGGVTALGMIDRITSDNDISNTAAQLTLYSYNFAAGQIPVNGVVELLLGGDFLHNNGGVDTMTLQILLGATVFYQDVMLFSSVVDAVRQSWELYVRIQNRGVANRQQMNGRFGRTRGAAPAIGLGNVDQAGAGAGGTFPMGSGVAALTVDTTLAQTFAVKCQWSAASINNSFALRSGYLTLA